MEFYFNLIWPQEWPLRIIIIFLWCVTVCVILKCLALKKRIANNLTKIEELGSNNGISYLENSLKLNNINYEATFAKFEADNDKTDDNKLVFDHLKAIFDAGRKSSRLDADLLVKNTIDKICTDVDTIKSCISVFLVIGILGTLIGLAISIGSFNGDSFIINAQANNTAKELSKLFSNLRGAFAPSMWGVFLTISFVIAYTVVIQEKYINKLTDKLTTNTIKVWLPALYPTDFQKGENTMVQLKETIQNADGINNSAMELLSNLSVANETVKSINGVSEVLSESINRFDDGSKKVAVLKDSIEALSKQIEENDQKYIEWLNNAITQTNQFQLDSKQILLEQANAVRENFAAQASAVRENFAAQTDAVRENFAEQNEQLKVIVNTLKIYDDHALRSQDELQKKLAESINNNMQTANDMQFAVGELTNRNKDIIAAVGAPLNQQLTGMSDKLTESLNEMTIQLKQVKASMDKIDSPLQSTADQLQEMFGNMLASMDQIMAAKSGIDAETIELLRSSAAGSASSTDNKNLEKKLDAILRCLESNAQNNGRVEVAARAKEKTTMELVKEYMPQLIGVFIAVALTVSVVLQFTMVNRIGALEQSQNAVNQVLLKGDKAN